MTTSRLSVLIGIASDGFEPKRKLVMGWKATNADTPIHLKKSTFDSISECRTPSFIREGV